MEIRNIAVAVDFDGIDADLVALAADLARQHGAALTGIAAAEPPMAGALYEQGRAENSAAMVAAKQAFAELVPSGVQHRWVDYHLKPETAVIAVARTVDLIIVGSPARNKHSRHPVDVGTVLISAGRPVLVAAAGERTLKAAKVVVAWKDTREARRAVVDSLPFLKAAEDVYVVVIDEGNLATERASMLDAVAWLASHGVKAHGDVLPKVGTAAQSITAAAVTADAGLIVSGAYGHSRLLEWALGGMTRDLLDTQEISRFFSN